MKTDLEKIRHNNFAKTGMLSIIAHDLKSPFLALIGYSDILLNDFKKLDEEEINFFLEEINIISRKTLNLLENLLNWSLMQNEDMELKKETFNLSEAVDETTNYLSNILKRKNISLVINVNNKTKVCFDRTALLTILRNLIHNAVKFTDEFGKISISSQLEAHKVDLSIEDTGTGISSKGINKLTDFFSKTSISEDQGSFINTLNHSHPGTKNEEGFGLGLIICKKLIDRGGGEIRVESKIGKGSKFTISLPCP